MQLKKSMTTKSEISLKNLAARLKNQEFKKVIVLVGAGISVSCGIPDFRTKGTGLYDNLEKFNLPTPQSVFDLAFFKQSRGKAFYELAKEIWPSKFLPSPAHCFIKLLEEQNILLRCYSQNIDTLETHTGLREELLIQAHGSFATSSCIKCKSKFDSEEVERRVLHSEVPILCKQADCENGLVKPDIVFFGERLPEIFERSLKGDFAQCDLLIIMGTSLSVHPFASLISLVADNTPRLLMNKVAVGVRTPFHPSGLRLFQSDNERDYFIKGDLDESVRAFADIVDIRWRDNLEEIISRVNSVKALSSKPLRWENFQYDVDFDFNFCHSVNDSDFPPIVSVQAQVSDSDNIEKSLEDLELSEKEAELKIVSFDKHHSLARAEFIIRGSLLDIYDEDDYLLFVEPRTMKLELNKTYIGAFGLHSGFDNDELKLWKVPVSLRGRAKIEVWYVSNETGKVKARFLLQV